MLVEAISRKDSGDTPLNYVDTKQSSSLRRQGSSFAPMYEVMKAEPPEFAGVTVENYGATPLNRNSKLISTYYRAVPCRPPFARGI